MKALDIIEETKSDGDDFSESPFTAKYHISDQKAMGLDDTYILHLSRNETNQLAIALSDHSLKLMDLETFAETRKWPDIHSDTITGLQYHPQDGGKTIFTSSSEGCIKLWDTRSNNDVPVITFRDTSLEQSARKLPVKPLSAFDVTPDGTLLCAGTEQVLKDTYLLFWDSRKSELVGGYFDSHEDDVVSVSFNKGDRNMLTTGGTDGVFNIFDVSKTNEDEALEATINTESSIQKLRWFHGSGKNSNKPDSIACILHTEELKFFKVEDDKPFCSLSRNDICSSMKRKKSSVTYVVDCQEKRDKSLVVLAGSSCSQHPCLRLLKLDNDDLHPILDLEVPNNFGIARCFDYLEESESLICGNEDGILRVWKKEEGKDISKKKPPVHKSEMSKKKKYNPY